ncbi:MAG: hypothetical protein ACLS76_02835 [Eubacterium callanderi]
MKSVEYIVRRNGMRQKPFHAPSHLLPFFVIAEGKEPLTPARLPFAQRHSQGNRNLMNREGSLGGKPY